MGQNYLAEHEVSFGVLRGPLGGTTTPSENWWQFDTDDGERELSVQLLKEKAMDKWAVAVEGSCPIDTAKIQSASLFAPFHGLPLRELLPSFLQISFETHPDQTTR